MNSSQLLQTVSQPDQYLANTVSAVGADSLQEPLSLTPANVSALTGERAASVLDATPSNFHYVTFHEIDDQTLGESERTYNALKALGVNNAVLILLRRFPDPKTMAIQHFTKKLSELHSVLSDNREIEPSELEMLNAISRRIEKLDNDPDHWSNLITHLNSKGVST